MTMTRTLRAFLAASLLLPLLASPGRTAPDAGPADAWARNDSGSVGLVAATTGVGTAATLQAGVAFRLRPGWHIYWRTPGDAGYPPKIDWSGSDNIGTPVLAWPAPRRIVLGGLQNYGYEGEVVLPVTLPLTVPGRPVRIKARIDYLACAKLCVPMSASLSLALPAGPAEPGEALHDIVRFKALVPGDGSRSGLTLVAAEAVGPALRLTVEAREPLLHPDVFVEGDDGLAFDPPQVAPGGDGRRAVLTVALTKDSPRHDLAGTPLTVTVVDGDRTLEAAITPVAATAAPAPAAPAPAAIAGEDAATVAAMLAVALLGGLILNLMPCVLPVLSIKVLGAMGHGGAERGHVRAAFVASASGILASFLALAGGAVAIKAAGRAVGWGIQFQHPGFLAAMGTILALFAANLWGLFEIPLPGWLFNTRPGRIPHHTLLGHFLSGAFATLLATPCSAPFLGTAIGFALARGPLEIVAIFAALGLGMAVPYLTLAVWPDAACRLPRPGPWMAVLKKVLGVALAATALWLLTVLAAQAGAVPAIGTGGALAAAIAVLAVRHRLPRAWRPAAGFAAAALAAAAVAAPYQAGFIAGDHSNETASGIVWVPFDQAAIPSLVAGGKVVFVDVTADWCITCKVNKAAVVDRGAVAARLAAGKVVAMKADWTRPDDGIARYLASFGRYGVPFNAVYGPAAPDGIPLSELLSEAETLAALDHASGRTAAAGR
jgi:suppressor for copper-sensitivity B